MRRRLFCLIAVAIALTARGTAAAEVTIGFANPLSGPYAASGNRNHAAVELAVEDLNRDGGVLGHEVRLVIEDDVCGLDEATAAARALIDAGAGFVVGHFCSHSSLLAAAVYDAAGVLMISPSSTHPLLTDEGRPNVFRLNGRDDDQGRLAARFLADGWADGNIAILHDGNAYGEGLASETRKSLRDWGVVETVYGAYTPGEDDYGALVAQLQRADIDVLYVGGYGPDAARILGTARARGDDLQLVGGDGLGMDEFWQIAGSAGEGTIYSGRPEVRGLPQAEEVLAQLRRRGVGSRTAGLAAYAAVQVWAQAVERAETFALGQVIRSLHRGRFETAIGRVAFDAKGDLTGAGWQWKVWSRGMARPIDLWTATR